MSYEETLRNDYAIIRNKFFPGNKKVAISVTEYELRKKISEQQIEIELYRLEVENLKKQLLVFNSKLSKVEELLTFDPIPTKFNFGPKFILHFIAKKENVDVNALLSGRRTQDLTQIRCIVWYLCRKLTVASFPRIGQITNRDHTTVISGIRTLQERMQVWEELHGKVVEYEKELFAIGQKISENIGASLSRGPE
jgi:hypothetical protein